MRAFIVGRVVEVQRRQYTNRQQQTVFTKRIHVRQDEGDSRYAADYFDAPDETVVEAGQAVSAVVNITAKPGVTNGVPDGTAYLSRWCVALTVTDPALRAAK